MENEWKTIISLKKNNFEENGRILSNMKTVASSSHDIFSPMSEERAYISILVVNLDYVMVKQTIKDDFSLKPTSPAILEPVIRVFGSTPYGQRTCAHIHGVYPYVYFRPESNNHPIFESEKKLQKFLPNFEKNIEELLHFKRISSRRPGQDEIKKRKHVHHLEIVRKRSIYGMFNEKSFFIKAVLYDPADIMKLGTILQEGQLAGISMESFESHIPYFLKFTSDFNISTMGWIHLEQVRFRNPLPKGNGFGDGTDFASPENVSPVKSNFNLTVNSPFKDLILSEEKKAKENKSRVRLYTSSTVLETFIWKDRTLDNRGAENMQKDLQPNEDVYITSTGIRIKGNIDPIVLEVLEGLREEDLISSQTETPKKSNPPPPQPPREDKKQKIPDISKKVSTCELEIDSHISHVLNSRMKRIEFGAELWEEERLRCQRKGLPFDISPTLQSTQTLKRTQQQTELDFYQRFERLQMKGAALRKTTKDILYTQKEVQKGNVLSQFLTADDIQNESGSKIGKGSGESKDIPIEEEISQWVFATIDNAKKEAEETEDTFHRACSDPDSLIDDYIKSQRTPSYEKSTLPPIRQFLGDNVEDEDKETEDSISREIDDILTSTQLDPPENKDLVKRKPGEIPEEKESEESPDVSFFTSPLNKMPAPTPPIHKAPVVLEFQDQSASEDYFCYSTPPGFIPDPKKPLGIAIRDEKVSGEDLIKDPVTSSVLGKRRTVDNKLASVFKKMKSTHKLSSSPDSKASLLDGSKTRSVRWKDDVDAKSSSFSNLFQSPAPGDTLSVPKSSSIPPSTPLMGILLKSAEKSTVSNEGLEKKKYKKSVSFVSKVVDIHLDTLTDLKESKSSSLSSSIVSNNETSDNSDSASDSSQKQPEAMILAEPVFEPMIYSPTKTLYLLPTFPAPRFTELKSLDSYNLPLVINPLPRFSSFPDTKELQRHSENVNADYNYYMASSHKVVFDKDLPKFTIRYQSPGGDSTENKPKISEKKHPNSFLLPQRSRCLLPTYEPPSPAKFWKHQKKLDEKAARVANSSNPSTVTATSIPSQLSTGTAGLHPSTQSSDPNELLLGAAADATDKMSRLVILSMELHCKTRKELLPNPKYDGIEMIVWIADDIISNAENEHRSKTAGILLVLTPNYRHQQPQNNSNNNNNRQQPSTNTEPNSTSTSSTLPNLDKEKENLYKEIKMNIHCISSISSFENTEIQIFSTELEMIQYFCYLSREIIDPDFLIGYESSNNSYGYLIKRGKIIGLDILQLLSRIPTDKPSFRNALVRAEMKENHPELFENEEAEDFHDLNSIQADVGIFIKGRTFLNTWHLLKSELKLWNNTIQYAVEHILQKTLPYFTPAQLTKWYQLSHTRYKTISYVYLLTLCNLLLIEKLDIIRKISECARLYGIDFFSVFHRGSQYRVEAALIVKAHAHDYLLLSPSKMKVANQAAMEVIPLVLEPRSHFYTDPVLVLDYQSLYPSMMLAYNLCYSTCMGKLKTGTISNLSATGGGGGGGSMPNMFPQDIPAETTGRLGVISYPESISAVNSTLHLKNLEKFFQERGGPGKNPSENKPKIDEHTPYVSPNGVVFCAKSVRQGILPMMIREMLDTRLMVKRSMKKHAKISTDGKKHNKVLEKVLDARQLAIKLLANVTYGYTGAGFSGRMPMAELADAIVQSARSTLEWTIRVINNHPKWKAQVVYGDTDSVFVHLPGRNLEQAFKIGEEIALEMTSNSPEDVVLKFEKVYYPCLLVSKKRYVGNCYEYPPPSPEILSKVSINPYKLPIPASLPITINNQSAPTTASSSSSSSLSSSQPLIKPKESYGKKEILSLLHKYSLQTKLNNYLFIDAKGIEMIRSDQCLLTQKLQKDILILLFSSFGNLSLIKSYLIMKWHQILQNNSQYDHPIYDPYENLSSSSSSSSVAAANQKEIPKELMEISFKDYIFSREVRFGTYASVSSQPPGAIVATKDVLQDEMAVPPYNWKVPYVVVYGLPNTPLKNLVYHPRDLLKRGSSLRINYLYYIMKQVNPSLDRLLSLCGINIFQWFQFMTRPKLYHRHFNYENVPRELLQQQYQQNDSHHSTGTIQQPILLLPPMTGPQQQQMSMEQYVLQRNCLICEVNLAKSTKLICGNCLKQFQSLRPSRPLGKRTRKRNSTQQQQQHSSHESPVDEDDLLTASSTSSSSSSIAAHRLPPRDYENYLMFLNKFKSLSIKNQIYTNICQSCVKSDHSYHFSNKNTSSQALQLYQKNELLGKENCANLSCDIFYQRLKLLLDLEDYTLVYHELHS